MMMNAYNKENDEKVKISNGVKKIIVSFVVLSVIASPVYVYAQDSGSQTKTVQLENPLGKNINNLSDLVDMVINFIAGLLLAVAAFFIIYSGFKFVTASGNPEKLKEAKESLKNALIGTALILAASAISKVIANLITSLQN